MRGEKKEAQERAATIRLTEWRVTPERKGYDEQFKAYASGADTSEEAFAQRGQLVAKLSMFRPFF